MGHSSDASDPVARIVEAVCDVLSEGGIEELTLRAVARRAGATTGLLMHHFPNRAALVRAALEATATKAAAAVPWPRTPDKAAVMAAIEAYLPLDASRRRDMVVWVSFWALAITSPDLREVQRRTYDDFREAQAFWIEQMGFSPEEARRRADRLLAMIDGTVIYALLDPDYWTPERQVDRVRATVDDLFAAAPSLPSSAG